MPDLSLLVPTHNRADALRIVLPALLAVRGVDEIVVVDDGSTDDTVAFVRACPDPRVRVVELQARGGVAAARNAAVAAARGQWLLFGEDDVLFGVDYAETLLAVAEREDAQIVGAPWLHVDPAQAAGALARGRAQSVDQVGMDAVHKVPSTTIVTPFLPAVSLIARAVFDAGVRFDSGYGGNAFREETDFFVAAARSGFRVVLTPETCSIQAGRFGGGHRRSALRYEYWALRNTARFLHRHGRWLARAGYIDGPLRAWARFALTRAKALVGGRVRRWRGR